MKKQDDHSACHHSRLPGLRRIEGQVRGVQKMIENHSYCVDILTQLHAVQGAVHRVQEDILRDHLQGCVKTAFSGGSRKNAQEKIDEIMKLLKRQM